MEPRYISDCKNMDEEKEALDYWYDEALSFYDDEEAAGEVWDGYDFD